MMWVLIGVTLASPLADLHPLIGALIALIVLSSVLAGASLVGSKKIIVRIAIPVAIVWILARLFEEFGSGHHFYHLAHFAGLGLSSVILWAIFDRLQTVSEVTSSVIAEAFTSYLIIAIAFSQIYWIFGDLDPSAFRPPIPRSQGTTFLYFSMAILTSLGYSDNVPVNPYLRLMTVLESMTGIFYVAVVVARLVSSRRE